MKNEWYPNAGYQLRFSEWMYVARCDGLYVNDIMVTAWALGVEPTQRINRANACRTGFNSMT